MPRNICKLTLIMHSMSHNRNFSTRLWVSKKQQFILFFRLCSLLLGRVAQHEDSQQDLFHNADMKIVFNNSEVAAGFIPQCCLHIFNRHKYIHITQYKEDRPSSWWREDCSLWTLVNSRRRLDVWEIVKMFIRSWKLRNKVKYSKQMAYVICNVALNRIE